MILKGNVYKGEMGNYFFITITKAEMDRIDKRIKYGLSFGLPGFLVGLQEWIENLLKILNK